MASPLERTFRITALAEATSFIVLLVATYVKYGHDEPTGVQILEPLHGLLFIACALLARNLAPRAGWTRERHDGAGGGPAFGGYAVDRRLARRPLGAAA